MTEYSLTYAALKPLGIATGLGLAVLGLAGWARYFHLRRGALLGLQLPLVALLYMGTALSYGVISVSLEASAARNTVRAGEIPDGFYGLHGQLMCVEQMADNVAVYNGPLPRDRAVFTFGSTGDRIWLWGPQISERGTERWTAMNVRLEDVTLTSPEVENARCRTR